MSIAAPTTFTVTGGATVTFTFAAWSTAGGAAAVAAAILATTTTVNSNTHAFSEFFDYSPRPGTSVPTLVQDIATAATVSISVATQLFQQLKAIVSMYIQQATNSTGVPFSIALA